MIKIAREVNKGPDTRCNIARNIVSNLKVARNDARRSRIDIYLCNITRNCFTVCPSSATVRATMLCAMMHHVSVP